MTIPAPAVRALASQINASMQRAIRDQRTYVETLAEQGIRDGHVHGFLSIASPGELIADITFPIAFVEKPLFTCGLEMGENTSIAWGKFPLHAATVTGWLTRTAGESTIWVGATVAVLVIDAERSILHYSFEGRSLMAPVGTEAHVGASL